MKCVFYRYGIRANKGRQRLTRRDTITEKFKGKTICGECRDRLFERLTEDEQPWLGDN